MENEEIEELNGNGSGAAVKKRGKGKRITLIIISGLLAALILAVGLFFCIGACTGKKSNVSTLKESSTTRKIAPTDGSLPTDHAGNDNIAYMAYVLDNQPSYHAYAYNSTKSTGVEQVTQTWKDYKSAALNGTANNIMVCTDLSYSTLVRAATQTCFVGDSAAYMRSGNKPKKDSTPQSVEWSTSQPDYYTYETYRTKYGEFSTEISVYALNEETIESWDDVIDNGDGTYTQKFYITEDAACWYQYGMKTRGGLKYLPEFEKIEITFTFDSKWQVLETYCEEKAKISPVALGGNTISSSAKTTTTFGYSESSFDNSHYSYFDAYFEKYVGQELIEGPSHTNSEPSIVDVIGAGFGKVMDENGNGQQFALDLKVGQTEYTGKVYAKLGDMNDILGSLDVRLALEKKGSGKQDLYVDFSQGAINVYYSDAFAMTADIDEVSSAVSAFGEWINSLGTASTADVMSALAEAQDNASGGLDLDSLLASLDFTYTDTSVSIALKTDDLLGLGAGVDVQMNFDRFKDGEFDSYSFRNLSISSLSYNSSPIDLALSLVPDDSSEIIYRDKSQTSANLADYINGLLGLLESNTYTVDINLDGSCRIDYLNGLTLSAKAQVKQENAFNTISVNVPINVSFNGVSISLEAYYTVNLSDGSYGEIYLAVNEINGIDKNFRIYCDISETVNAVKEIIALFNSESAAALSEDGGETDAVANAINMVLGLDYGAIICGLKADKDEMSVTVNVDELLGAFGADFGVGFGELVLTVLNGNKATLGASLSALGLSISISGTDEDLTAPDKNDYTDAMQFVATAKEAAVTVLEIIGAQDIEFTLNGLDLTADGVKMSVEGKGEAVWKDGKTVVALDLIFTISENGNSQTVAVKFVYDETASENGAPLVRFAINELGFEIYQSDLDETETLIKDVISSIGLLTGANTVSAQTASLSKSAVSEEIPLDYVKIITAVLKVAGNLSIELCNSGITDSAVRDILIRYADYASLKLGANGGLSVDVVINNNSAEVLRLGAVVNAGCGNVLNDVNSSLDGYTYKQAETFLKEVYDYIFDLLDELTVKDILGSDTYTVEIAFDGTASGIKALDGISVNANLYYTEINSKLLEAELVLDIHGTQVEANVYYTDRTVYISLLNVGGTKLEGVSFSADAGAIYDVARTLVEIITSGELAEILSILSGENVQALSLENGTGASSSVSLAKVINCILTLDFDSVVTFEKVDGKNTLTLNPDGILEALGAGFTAGTVYIEADPVTHSIYASVTSGGNEWLTLNAQAVENSEHAVLNPDNFIDINFVSTLLKDLKASLEFVMDNGEEDTGALVLSFKGDLISINLASVATIKITDVTVTAGINEDKSVYFTLYGYLNNSTYTTARYISVTYADGYITFGRDVDKASAIYKVMTLHYLIDNIMDSNNSPARWLLGTSTTLWKVIASAVRNLFNFNLDSGLTVTEDLYLYYLYNGEQDEEQTQPSEDDGIFRLSDLINGLTVKLGDNYASTYGNNASSAISKFGLSDSTDYYAFDLNLSKVISALGNLYAVLTRNPDGGIAGLYANTSISSAEITINLNGGLTKDHAENYFAEAVEEYGINFNNFDGHENLTFGCYNTENNSYESSAINPPYQLNVYVFDEEKEYGNYELGDKLALSKKLNLGSIVYLFEEELWLNDEHTSKLIFVDAEGNDLGLSFVISGDIDIYQMKVGAKTVTYHTPYGDSTAEVFIGSSIPNPENTVIDGKTFAGWYLNEEFTEQTFTILYANDYYARYVDTSVTADNGVVYTFTMPNADERTVGYYSATGFTQGRDGADYSLSSNTLVLESNVNGFDVTEIAKDAFNYNKTGIRLKKVIVPETVVTVGAQAFMDNKDMELAVFLAEKVTFMGTAWDGSNRFVFYGCGITGNESTTKLQLCYNMAYSEDNNTDWFGFFREQKGLTSWSGYNHYYIGNNGGSRNGTRYDENNVIVSEGSAWSYVTFKLDGTIENCPDLTPAQLGFTDAVYTTEFDAENARGLALKAIDNITLAYGCYGAYAVEIKVDKVNGTTAVTVVISDNSDEGWYKFVFGNSVESCTADYEISSEDFAVIDGVTYVRAYAEITLTAEGDEINSFSYWKGLDGEYEEANCTFAMPASTLEVTAMWHAAYAENVYVYSQIDFTYRGENYSAGNAINLDNAVEGQPLDKPASDGYEFIGWAKADGTALTIAEDTTVNSDNVKTELYALWYSAREDVEFTVNGASVTASVKEGYGSFEGWYNGNDTAFGGKLSSDNSYTLTTDNTAIRARLSYTLTADFSASNTIWGYTVTNTESVNDSMSRTGNGWTSKYSISGCDKQFGSDNCGLTITLLEGYSVKVFRYYSDGITVRVYDAKGVISETYLIKGYNNNSSSTSARKQFGAENTGNGVEFSNEWTVNTDAGIELNSSGMYYKLYDNNDDLLFASVNTVNSNLSFTAKV